MKVDSIASYNVQAHNVGKMQNRPAFAGGQKIIGSLASDVLEKTVGKTMHSITDLKDLRGKKVLVRVDWNVPVDDAGKITDTTRIDESMATINYLRERGAKVILMSHLGRPKGQVSPEFSLKPIMQQVNSTRGEQIKFLGSLDEAPAEIANMRDGEIGLLENIRFYAAEEAKDNDMTMAKKLADMGDIYVNDAFGTAHRRHTSTAKLADQMKADGKPAVSGLLLEKEVNTINGIINEPVHPAVAIVGGSKVSTKFGVLDNLAQPEKFDKLLIVGGMRHTIAKALGGKIGNSLHEDAVLADAARFMDTAKARGVDVYLPRDVIATNDFSGNGINKVVDGFNIPDGFEGVDAGPKSRAHMRNIIKEAKKVLWNGPAGVFENPKFAEGTEALAKAVVEAADNGAKVVVGGGDSVAAAKSMLNAEELSKIYCSTGGGASMEMVEGKTLPGVKALMIEA